jgi:hypothetical protein
MHNTILKFNMYFYKNLICSVMQSLIIIADYINSACDGKSKLENFISLIGMYKVPHLSRYFRSNIHECIPTHTPIDVIPF